VKNIKNNKETFMKYLFESLNKNYKVGSPTNESSSKYLPIDDEEDMSNEMNVTGNLDGGEGPPRTPLVFKRRKPETKEKPYKFIKKTTFNKIERDKEKQKTTPFLKQESVINFIDEFLKNINNGTK
tara:strand:+ start:4687 stop:5064 length:378 start_codon:yes stop_codon:yes gene_type:complete